MAKSITITFTEQEVSDLIEAIGGELSSAIDYSGYWPGKDNWIETLEGLVKKVEYHSNIKVCPGCHGLGTMPQWIGCGCGRGIKHFVSCNTYPPQVRCEECNGTGIIGG